MSNEERFILLVDDDPAHMAMLERMFVGLTVRVVRSGYEAVALMETATPVCVVLDLMMPGMDGWEVAAWIKAQERLKLMPVVVVTAYHEERFEQQANRMKLDGYIRKPVSLQQFLAAVSRVIPIDILREIHKPCLICGRTDDPLLDVTTVSEAEDLWKKKPGVIRSNAMTWQRGKVRSGVHWLLSYAVAATEFAGETFAWQYWIAPELPCPMCGRSGDPLRDVICLGDPVIKSLGRWALSRLRYAIRTGGNIHARRAGYYFLLERQSMMDWLSRLDKLGDNEKQE